MLPPAGKHFPFSKTCSAPVESYLPNAETREGFLQSVRDQMARNQYIFSKNSWSTDLLHDWIHYAARVNPPKKNVGIVGHVQVLTQKSCTFLDNAAYTLMSNWPKPIKLLTLWVNVTSTPTIWSGIPALLTLGHLENPTLKKKWPVRSVWNERCLTYPSLFLTSCIQMTHRQSSTFALMWPTRIQSGSRFDH